MEKYNKKMADYIRDWGLPKYLEGFEDEIIFKFDDNGLCDVDGMGYHCYLDDVKFCLFNIKLKKVLFTMDFYLKDKRCAFGGPIPRVNLQFIYTHSAEYRRKGIADYYISKLREYAIMKKANCINVTAVPNVVIDKNDNGLNRLKGQKLKCFYKKRSTVEMPIKVTMLDN